MIPERYAPVTYALFRIVTGYLFLIFGLQKIFGWFGGNAAAFGEMQWFAGAIETGAGLLVMLGLFSRVAAFIASGEMAYAYFAVHVMQLGMPPMGPGMPTGLLVPQTNRGVDAALFCFIFLYIATRGSGIWSVDQMLGRKR